jgi:DNA-directed RNA polymerase specialized sigma subunit
MPTQNLYTNAHLMVAAVRVLSHQLGSPPSLEKVAAALQFSKEKSHFICRKLEEASVIEIIEGAFGNRIVIKDHLKLEDIPKGDSESKLDEELKKFKSGKKELEKRVESIKSEQDKKQKQLFADIEEKLKKQL